MERKVLSSDTVSYPAIWMCVLQLCFTGRQTFACCVWSILTPICKPRESRDSIQRLCKFFPLSRPLTLFVLPVFICCAEFLKPSFSRWTVRSHVSAALWGTDCLVPVALRITSSRCVPRYLTKFHANVQQSLTSVIGERCELTAEGDSLITSE